MTKRASLEELLEFCQKVRAAGGGAVLDALMPAVPKDPTQCLIAKNLNFNCEVDTVYFRKTSRWAMSFGDDKELRDRIAAELGLAKCNSDNLGDVRYRIILPPEIGQVAADYDDFEESLECLFERDWDEDGEIVYTFVGSERDRKDLLDFWPYIEESEKETYELATVINKKGEIVI